MRNDDFTSKELDPTTSLYYGVYPALGGSARYYNPWACSWMSVDPLAKKYPGWSPYNYVEDNPTRFIDPEGDSIRYSGTPRQITEMRNWVNKIGSAPVAKSVVSTLRTEHQIVTLRFGDTKVSLEHGLTVNKLQGIPGTKNVKYDGSVITLFTHQKGFNDIGTTAHELYHAYQGLTQTNLAYKDGLIEAKMTLPITTKEYYSSYYNLPVEAEARLFSSTARSELEQLRHK